MALRLRRGTAAQRTSITPAEGELLYTTDTKLVYVGDGTTAGGNVISGGGGGSTNLDGLTDVTITSPVNGQVLKYNGTQWINGADATGTSGISNVVEDITPQLGGDLDVNGKRITSTSNGDIILDPNGTGAIVFNGVLDLNAGIINCNSSLSISPSGQTFIGSGSRNIDGSMSIITQTYSSNFLTSGFLFQQHHNTADSINMAYYRTRGTFASPTVVQLNDDIIDFTFYGYGSGGPTPAAGISITVDQAVTTRTPAKISFLTDNGTNTAVRAELSSTGTWKINNLSSLTGSSVTLLSSNTLNIGNVQLTQLGLSTYQNNANLALTANGTGTISINGMLFPKTSGTNGQVLTTDGSGTLTWTTVSSGGSNSRTTLSIPTGIISNAATANLTLTGYKGYILYKIETSAAAWVRIYTDIASRTSDSSRLEGVDPLPGSGVIAEVITTGAQTILISPGVIGFNGESSPSSNIYLAVTNKSGGSVSIVTTLTALQIEV